MDFSQINGNDCVTGLETPESVKEPETNCSIVEVKKYMLVDVFGHNFYLLNTFINL